MNEHLRKIQWVKFRNDGGSTAPAGAVLRITGFDKNAEEPFFKVDQPNTFGAQYGHAINDDRSVVAGKYGRCCLGQLVPARCDEADGEPGFGELWGPRAGSWKLKKNTGGFRVMSEGYVGDSSRYRALVNPHPFTGFRGTLVDPLLQGEAGACKVYFRSSRTGYTDTTVELDVLNDLDVDLDADAVVWCEYELDDDGVTVRWRIVNGSYTCTPP